jgi:hypothetical protein
MSFIERNPTFDVKFEVLEVAGMGPTNARTV